MPATLSDRHSFLEVTRGPMTAVAGFRASPGERRQALSRSEAHQIVAALAAEARRGERQPLRALAAALGEPPRCGAHGTDLITRVSEAIERDALLLLPGWHWARPATKEPAPKEPATWVTSAGTATKRFELTILDGATGSPVTGVALDLVTPSGDERRVTTDSDGRVRLSDLAPGTCSVTSVIDEARVPDAYAPSGSADPTATRPRAPADRAPPPRPAVLVEVSRHRVRTGETPSSIARLHDLSWERIALFNWGTAEPAALQRHYRETLGCARRTPDGRSLRFDDGDDPGIVLIPRRWEATLAVGPAHALVVTPLRTVFLTLENEAGLPLPAAAYGIRFDDGSERRGRLGRRGIARLEGVPDQSFSVSYPDQLELLATSFAVSVRSALDQQATAPLFTLLMQSQAVVQRAFATYDQHLNDLGGRGLRADIDQVVTDPEARRPLMALLSMAGL